MVFDTTSCLVEPLLQKATFEVSLSTSFSSQPTESLRVVLKLKKTPQRNVLQHRRPKCWFYCTHTNQKQLLDCYRGMAAMVHW